MNSNPNNTILNNNVQTNNSHFNNNIPLTNPRLNILNIRPARFENYTASQINEGVEIANQMVIDRLGHYPAIQIINQTQIKISNNTEIQVANQSQRNETEHRVIEITESIRDQNGLIDYIFKILIKAQELSLPYKITILGGVLILIGGGLYISYRLIRRIPTSSNIPQTLITPFGPRRNLSLAGRVLEAILYRK